MLKSLLIDPEKCTSCLQCEMACSFEHEGVFNPAKSRIYVFIDNARYHKARLVRQWLERPDCRITPIFQPSYAPHLNAIERLWGVMHREVTHNKFYANFALFIEAIFDFFRQRLPREWKTWRDTITDNFRIISHKDFRVLGRGENIWMR